MSAAQPYAARAAPKPSGEATLPGWAVKLSAWLGAEFGNVQRGFLATSKSVTADYRAKLTDSLLLVDATAGNVVITLPTPSTVPNMQCCIKRIDGSGNTVTILGTIDATTDPTLAQWESRTVWADLSASSGAWYLIAST